MSKIQYLDKQYTLEELRELSAGAANGILIDALLDHIEAQQDERQAFVAGAEFGMEYVGHKAQDVDLFFFSEEADALYPSPNLHPCTECPAQTDNPHSTSLCYSCQIKQLMTMLEDYQKEQARPMPTREMVLEMFGRFVYDKGAPYNEQLADAVMRLIGGQNA